MDSPNPFRTVFGARPASWRVRDPRLLQIGALTGLLTYGVFALGFDIDPAVAWVFIATCQVTQYFFVRWFSVPVFDPKSPLISSLSLCLLVRTHDPLIAGGLAVAVISSKFLIRRNNKHIFNPTAFGVALALLLGPAFGVAVWVSPGQWGSTVALVYLLSAMGITVAHKSERADITFAFLIAYSSIVFGRALYLGDPWTIPAHHLQSGALLIFAFHMISDPKTTPDSRRGRVVFAILVAALAGFVQFGLFRPHGPVIALVALAPAFVFLDGLWPGLRHRWPGLPLPLTISRSS